MEFFANCCIIDLKLIEKESGKSFYIATLLCSSPNDTCKKVFKFFINVNAVQEDISTEFDKIKFLDNCIIRFSLDSAADLRPLVRVLSLTYNKNNRERR